jgi:hypothetical protein
VAKEIAVDEKQVQEDNENAKKKQKTNDGYLECEALETNDKELDDDDISAQESNLSVVGQLNNLNVKNTGNSEEYVQFRDYFIYNYPNLEEEGIFIYYDKERDEFTAAKPELNKKFSDEFFMSSPF